MCGYIQELFELELSSGRLSFGGLPGAEERLRRLNACHNEIHTKLGLDFLDRLNDLEGEGAYEERLACFRYGFRLAVRLLLD